MRLNIRKVMITLAFALPIWSILLGLTMPMTNYNLSYIGNTLKMRFGFILWGSLSGAYFYVSTHYLMLRLNWPKDQITRGITISCLMMVLSTIIPYLPKVYPLLSNLHLVMAMGGTVAYVILFLAFIYRLMLVSIPLFQKALQGYLFVCISCILPIMLFASVTTLSEVLFTTFMPLYHQYLLKLVQEYHLDQSAIPSSK